jgi:hypothetical protein
MRSYFVEGTGFSSAQSGTPVAWSVDLFMGEAGNGQADAGEGNADPFAVRWRREGRCDCQAGRLDPKDGVSGVAESGVIPFFPRLLDQNATNARPSFGRKPVRLL